MRIVLLACFALTTACSTLPRDFNCGDGLVNTPNESCDDGNTNDGDGCDDICRIELGYDCGADEDCSSGICDATDGHCEARDTCGNGRIEDGEDCDDGGTSDEDGCDSDCRLEPPYPLGYTCNADEECTSAWCNDTCWSKAPTFFKPVNTGSGYRFGYSLALDGQRLVVGADVGNSVHIYESADDGSWQLLLAAQSATSDSWDDFGEAVAIEGDTVVVGASGEDSCPNASPNTNGCSGAGAAYIWEFNGIDWIETILKPSNGEASDSFGVSVAISGDTVAVGAHREDSCSGDGNSPQNNECDEAGAVYIFERIAGEWTETAYLKSQTPMERHFFGRNIALDGDHLVVSNEDDSCLGGQGADFTASGCDRSGGAFIFARHDDGWAITDYIKAEYPQQDDLFAGSVAMHDGVIVIGSDGDDNCSVEGDLNCWLVGAAFVYRYDGSAWIQEGYLKASNAYSFTRFGKSVAIADDTISVGAHWEDECSTTVNEPSGDLSCQSSGAAYQFRYRDGQWVETGYLKSTHPEFEDYFGFATAVGPGIVAVSAPFEDSCAADIGGDPADNGCDFAGGVFVWNEK